MHTATELFPNSRVAEAVTDYAINMSTSLGDAIHQHRTDTIEYTKVAGLDPLMMINTLEAQTMVFIAKMIRAKRILEIGCFTGYSALCWAKAVESYPDGEVVTLDLDYSATIFARETFKKTGTDNVIKLITGDASTTIQTLTGEFDLIFIDANKDGYVDYLQRILSQKLLAPNGLILADNTLYRGLVAKKAIAHNPAAEPSMIAKAAQLDQFNVFVDHHPDLENVLLAAFDGLNFIRYKDGVRK